MESILYIAVGEEAARGGGQAATVGFIEVAEPFVVEPEFDDKKRNAMRGESTQLGAQSVQRMGESFTTSVPINLTTEAGTVKGMIGTLFKHLTGSHNTGSVLDTSAYPHIFYPTTDMYGATNLDTKALALNYNSNEENTNKNYPYLGIWVTGCSIVGEPGGHMVATFEMSGQKRDTVTAELGSVVMPAENLRLDFSDAKFYTGTITKTGTGPNYTAFAFGSATQIYPDNVNITIANNVTPRKRGSGLTVPDTARVGLHSLEIEMTFDFTNRVGEFDTIAEFNAWVAGSSEQNFAIEIDTGILAGAATETHKMVIDIPRGQRMGGSPERASETTPIITLKYEVLFDTTDLYPYAIFLQNSSATV